MFRALELRTLELTLCFHSDTVTQYLDQTIRDAHPVFVSKTVPVYLHRPALVPPLYFIRLKGFPLVFLRWDPAPCWTDKSFPNRLVLGCVKSTVVSLSFSFFFVTVKSLLVALLSLVVLFLKCSQLSTVKLFYPSLPNLLEEGCDGGGCEMGLVSVFWFV
jgi:hypothetical protein